MVILFKYDMTILEEENKKTSLTDKSKIITLINMLSTAEQAYAYIGLLVCGLVKLQDELGIGRFVEKLSYLPNKKSILDLFTESSEKIRQYSNEEIYKHYEIKLNKIESLASESLIKSDSGKNIDDSSAKLSFEIGFGLGYKYFFSGEEAKGSTNYGGDGYERNE